MSWGGQVEHCKHFGSLEVRSLMFNVVYLERAECTKL
jgi:hypothetical protein